MDKTTQAVTNQDNRMKITLLSGKELECYRGADFTDRYASIGAEESRLILNDFKESAWLFLNNTEKIMADSRMFLAPVYSQSFSPFFSGSRPRIGTFLEWWLHYPQFSCDKEGNPIFCISGNPMTGSHACHVIDPEGNSRKASEKSFLRILTSFGKINSLYKDAKLTCEHYELQEVIRLLDRNQ